MLFLLRHGEIETDGTKRFIGRTDLPLSAEGKAQARFWRDAFSGISFSGIYSSDLARSIDTARIISEKQAQPPLPMRDLGEIDLGDWDGLAMAEVREKFPAAWRERGEALATFRPPGGESFADLQIRAVRALESIFPKNMGDILIVAHAGVNRAILCRLLGMDLANLFRLGQDFAGLHLIDTARTPFRVVLMNLNPERAKEFPEKSIRPS